ncbi:MAG: hypothetical protein ACFE0R_04480 [Salinarimonas sp.]
MRTLALTSLALATLAAGAAQAQDASTPEGETLPLFERAAILPLEQLDFEPAQRDLWSGRDMLEADLLGPGGDDIGDVEDILVTTDGYAVAVVVELDELLEWKETTVSMPLSTLELLPGANAIRSPIAPDGLQLYSAFDVRTLTARIVSDQVAAIADDDLDEVVTGADLLLFEETLLGGYAPLPDGTASGYVHDVLFSMEGAAEVVVISAARGVFDGIAVPFTGGIAPRTPAPDPFDAQPFGADELGVRE